MACLKKSIVSDNLEPVLIKLNKENTQFRDIHIDKDEFTIGRAKCNNEVIVDMLISRQHAVIKHDENDYWTIENLSSTMTLLNDIPLERGVPKKLSHGDFIQFTACKEFTYVFKLPSHLGPEIKRQRIDQCLLDTVLNQQKTFSQTQEIKRKVLEEKLQTRQSEQNELRATLDELLRNQELAQNTNQNLNNKIVDLQTQIKNGNDVELQLQQSYNNLLSTLETERQKFEENLNEERQKWQTALDMSKQEKETVERNMKEQMDKWREQQQAEWSIVMQNLVQQEKIAQERLLYEKRQLEQKLKETENALKEQAAITEQLQTAAKNVKANDSTTVKAPDCILVQLLDDGTMGQMEVVDTIDLTVPSQSYSNAHDNEVFTKVGNIMDEQLTCSICSELFVKAVTVNCMHSFCHHCIISWMNKKRECPVCRSAIKAVNRSMVLDNFIEEMMENLSPQLRARRKELIAERKAMEKPFVTIKVKGRK